MAICFYLFELFAGKVPVYRLAGKALLNERWLLISEVFVVPVEPCGSQLLKVPVITNEGPQ
jgi:hypothetical protein